MISFVNDYSNGACPEILEVMINNNFENNNPYGRDYHTENAIKLIREKIKKEKKMLKKK